MEDGGSKVAACAIFYPPFSILELSVFVCIYRCLSLPLEVMLGGTFQLMNRNLKCRFASPKIRRCLVVDHNCEDGFIIEV